MLERLLIAAVPVKPLEKKRSKIDRKFGLPLFRPNMGLKTEGVMEFLYRDAVAGCCGEISIGGFDDVFLFDEVSQSLCDP